MKDNIKYMQENTVFDVRKVQIADLFCDLFVPEGYDGGTDCYPVIYVNGEIPTQEILKEIVGSGIRPDFILLAVKPASWNDDFTPWSSPAFRKGEMPPQGKANDYIARLSGQIKPYIDAVYRTKPEPEHTALLGYSLGGLTAVYSLYQTDRFGVVGSLSGSLWYDGFCDYMDRAKLLRTNVSIYLSLGKKEKLSRNPRMGQVADCTQRVREILMRQIDADPQAWQVDKQGGEYRPYNRQPGEGYSSRVYFEWNEGGHFHELEKRFAKAVLWCLTATDF